MLLMILENYAIKIYGLALALALCKNYNFLYSRIKIIGLRQSEKIHEEILTKEELYNLKIYKNIIYVIDHMNLHKLSKVKKMMSFFSSDQAKVLTVNQIINYLKKFNLFTTAQN